MSDAIVHIDQMSIMNFEDTFLKRVSHLRFFLPHDFKVNLGQFRFGSFLNNRLKWSVRVVTAMLKVGASLITSTIYTRAYLD